MTHQPAVWFYKSLCKALSSLTQFCFLVFLCFFSPPTFPPASWLRNWSTCLHVQLSRSGHLWIAPAVGQLHFVHARLKNKATHKALLQRLSSKAHHTLQQRGDLFWFSSLNKSRSLLTLCQHPTPTLRFLLTSFSRSTTLLLFLWWPRLVSLSTPSASMGSPTLCTS